MPVRSRAARFLAVVVLLAVSVSVAGTAVAAPDADACGVGERPLDSGRTIAGNAAGTSPQLPSVTQDPVESINQTIRIDVQPDGSARWTVTMRATVANGSGVPLSDLESDYENGETGYLPVDPYRAASERVSAAAGRSMEIRNVSRRASVDNRTLSMELSFTWTNFGSVEGNRLAVRDVFNGTAGEWFPSLEGFQTLVMTPPDGYDISSVDNQATLRNRTLRWFGPVTFDGRTPHVIYVESGAGRATTATSVSISTTPGPGPGQGGGLLVPAVVVLLVGLLAVLAVVASRSDRPLFPPAGEAETETEASDGGTEAAVAPTDDPADDEPTEAESPAGPTGVESADVAGVGAAADDEATEDDIDEELLSDEERVERLLERNGGRMKQANIVSETDWSNAKVSQLLTSMAEDERIEKLRIGRENLISFPDEDDDLP